VSNKRIFALIAALLVLVVALAGCGQAAVPEAAAENPPAAEEQPSESAGGASDADLSITGLVGSEQALARADLEAMDTIEVVTTNKDGEEKTYSGVLISALLDKAAVQDGATTIVFIADDGYEVEAPLADIQSCTDCIVAIDGDILRSVLPGQPGNMQVKGLVELRVK